MPVCKLFLILARYKPRVSMVSFAKTGSGQAMGKLRKRRLCRVWRGMRIISSHTISFISKPLR
jgi:hypothetical protein